MLKAGARSKDPPNRCHPYVLTAVICAKEGFVHYCKNELLMKTQNLKFPDLQSLWRFKVEANLHALDILTSQSILRGPCTEKELLLAQTKYQATVVQVKPYPPLPTLSYSFCSHSTAALPFWVSQKPR